MTDPFIPLFPSKRDLLLYELLSLFFNFCLESLGQFEQFAIAMFCVFSLFLSSKFLDSWGSEFLI